MRPVSTPPRLGRYQSGHVAAVSRLMIDGLKRVDHALLVAGEGGREPKRADLSQRSKRAALIFSVRRDL